MADLVSNLPVQSGKKAEQTVRKRLWNSGDKRRKPGMLVGVLGSWLNA
jgi:hypothetical protein